MFKLKVKENNSTKIQGMMFKLNAYHYVFAKKSSSGDFIILLPFVDDTC